MDKEAELLKIQIFADYCHSDFTFRSSISVSGFVCSKFSLSSPNFCSDLLADLSRRVFFIVS